MVECATIAAASVHEHSIVSVPLADACCDLLELLRGVSDGRSDQGRDQPVAAVLALSAAATVAGMRGYIAIAGWVDDVPAGVLADLYMRAGAAPAGPPSKTTIWRVLTDADAEAFDAAMGAWLMNHLLNCAAASAPCAEDVAEPMQVRLDGKTIRGAKSADGSQLHAGGGGRPAGSGTGRLGGRRPGPGARRQAQRDHRRNLGAGPYRPERVSPRRPSRRFLLLERSSCPLAVPAGLLAENGTVSDLADSWSFPMCPMPPPTCGHSRLLRRFEGFTAVAD